MTAPADEVLALVAAMAPDTAPAPGLHSALVADLGYTSLRLLELSIALEGAFGLPPLGPEAFVGVATVGDLVDLVEAQRNRP